MSRPAEVKVAAAAAAAPFGYTSDFCAAKFISLLLSLLFFISIRKKMSSPSIRLAQVLDDDSDPNIRLMPQQQPYDPKQKNAKDEIHILDGKNSPQNISLYGFLLGMVCSAGLMFSLLGQSKIPQFGIFLAALSLFHFLEYIATALFNADKLSLDCTLEAFSRLKR